MIVKFNKKQIKALATIHARAVSFFDKIQADIPGLYKEEERDDIIRCFELGILDNIIKSGEFFLKG